jgi:flagellar protein FlbD
VLKLTINLRQNSDVRDEQTTMINVTRLNHTPIILNSDLIQFIENTPDTVITMTDDRKMTILETAGDVIERIRSWRRSLLSPEYPSAMAGSLPGESGAK